MLMKNIDFKEARVKNLQLLCGTHGRDIVRVKCGYDDTNYFNQLFSGHGAFGNRTAAKIENAMDLPLGWLSKERPSQWGEECEATLEQFDAVLDELISMSEGLPEGDKKVKVLEAISRLSQS